MSSPKSSLPFDLAGFEPITDPSTLKKGDVVLARFTLREDGVDTEDDLRIEAFGHRWKWLAGSAVVAVQRAPFKPGDMVRDSSDGMRGEIITGPRTSENGAEYVVWNTHTGFWVLKATNVERI